MNRHEMRPPGRPRDRTCAKSPGRAVLVLAAAIAATLILGVALAGAAAPTVSIEPAGNVQFTTAHVEGEVNPEDHETSYHFEYVTQTRFEASEWAEASAAGFGSVGAGEPPVKPSEELSGLAPGAIYHLRLVAENVEAEHAEAIAAGTFETKAVAKPLVTGLTAGEGHFSGMVNPNAPKAASELEGGSPEEEAINGAYATHWRFTCNPDCSFSGPGEGDLKADNAASAVSADPTGLQPHKAYDVILHATNAGGETTEAKVAAFTTPAVGPTIARETLWEPTRTSIQLNANVNAHNSVLTDCHFEWGAGSTLDHSTPCEAPYEGESYVAPDNEGNSMVSARISGLAPGTKYSFRLVAGNDAGAEAETVRSFESLQEAPPETCPNAAIRHQQHADGLPDCRAYEMATPVEKGNGDISAAAFTLTTVASSEGNALTFSSRTPFGDTLGSGNTGHTTYVARRSATGWSSRGVTPTSNPEANQVGFASTRTQLFAEDLSSVTVWAYDLAVEGDTPKRQNIYAEDTLSREVQPVTPLPESAPPVNQFRTDPVSWGQSADGRHIAFEAQTKYLPEAEAGVPNLYQWDEGRLSLVGRLPDGSIPASGSWTKKGPPSSLHTMSADGSRELFYAAPNGSTQLYQRIDGSRTVWISEPEGPDKTEPTGVELQAGSPDGRTVLFTTESPLSAEDHDQEMDLYRWTDTADPAGEANLTLISSFEGGDEVVGMSEDGSRIYLLSEAQTGGRHIGVWDEGEDRRIENTPIVTESVGERYGVLGELPGNARVTSNGRYLAFLNSAGFRGPAEVTPGEVVYPPGIGKEARMYLYDFRNDSLRCVSCGKGIGDYEAIVIPLAAASTNGLWNSGFRPRFLAADGRAFFSTASPLSPEDVNGVPDTYEYDPQTGGVTLLSSGRGQALMTFADASANGNDVFIGTRQRLASPDSDELVDVYDARVDGGFPQSQALSATPCDGEACQPVSNRGAPSISPGSATAGKGNVAARGRRCSRKAIRHRRGSSRPCGKRKHKHARQRGKRTVNVNGRTSK